MPHNPTPPPDDPEQSKRFIDTARQVEADEDPEAFEKAFREVVKPKEPRRAISTGDSGESAKPNR